MKYLLSLLALVSLVPNIALADVVPENQHGVNSCLTIDNQGAYPAYNFWISGTSRGYGGIRQLFAEENCDLGGLSGEIIAVKKTDQSKVKNQPTDANAESYIWSTDPVNRALVIHSNVDVGFEGLAPNTSRVVESQTIVHIDTLTADKMTGRITRVTTKDDLNQVKLVMEDKGGAEPIAPVVTPAPAEPMQPAIMPVNTQVQPIVVYRDTTNYWVVGELAVFGIIGLLLLAKTWKK